MALENVAAALTDPDAVPWRTCQVCHALAGMTDGDAATLRRLLSDRNVRFSELEAALRDDPDSPTIGRDALSRHARGICGAREVLR